MFWVLVAKQVVVMPYLSWSLENIWIVLSKINKNPRDYNNSVSEPG